MHNTEQVHLRIPSIRVLLVSILLNVVNILLVKHC